MVDIYQVPVTWSGWTGAPAYSNFYLITGVTTTQLDLIHDFFDDSKSLFAGAITWTIPSAGNVINAATGEITGGWTATPTAATVSGGAGASVFAAAAGYSVQWRTNSFLNSRRIIGHTFMVPIAASCFATDGTLDTTYRSTATTAAASLVTDLAGRLVVWHRPVNNLGGAAAVVTASSVPDRAAVLRSRRG